MRDENICQTVIMPIVSELYYNYLNSREVGNVLIRSIYRRDYRFLRRYIDRLNRYKDINEEVVRYRDNMTKKRKKIINSQIGKNRRKMLRYYGLLN